MTDLDHQILALIKRCRVVKAADLRFWTGRDAEPSIQRLERLGAIEFIGPAEPAQHWRALPEMEFA